MPRPQRVIVMPFGGAGGSADGQRSGRARSLASAPGGAASRAGVAASAFELGMGDPLSVDVQLTRPASRAETSPGRALRPPLAQRMGSGFKGVSSARVRAARCSRSGGGRWSAAGDRGVCLGLAV